MHTKFHLVSSPMCPCGEAEQTAQHVLQDCRNHRLLREEIWPTPAALQEKLHGPVDALQRITYFRSRAALQV